MKQLNEVIFKEVADRTPKSEFKKPKIETQTFKMPLKHR